MEGETNPPQQPMLCKTGCGFYGNQASDGLCSKCYKDNIKRSQDASQSSSLSSSASSSAVTTTTSMSQTSHSPKLNAVVEKPVISSPSTPTSVEKVADETKSETEQVTESDAASSLDVSLSPDKGKKKNRCNVCRKKLGLTGFQCRCNGLFCGIHRYSDKHDCTFDYKADGREQIAKQNPVVVGEKVKKI